MYMVSHLYAFGGQQNFICKWERSGKRDEFNFVANYFIFLLIS